MVEGGISLARAELLKALVSRTIVTSADGAGTNDSFIASDLIGLDARKIVEKTILISSGLSDGEDAASVSFNPVTGEVSTSPAFSHQILAGTIVRVVNISSVELDVVNILARIGTNLDPAGTTTIFAWFAKIWGAIAGMVVGNGTLTFSSATVPADATRIEGNGFFDNDWLMPIIPGVAYQPKKIGHFLNAGGVFQMDPEHPFDAAPGLVPYVILRPTDDMLPAADSVNNITPAEVIGRKDDTGNQTPDGVSSQIRYLKGLLDIISGAGIVAFPVSAAPANGVNVAAVIRKIYDLLSVTFQEQAAVAFNVNATNAGETNVLNLATAATRYIVRSLRLKSVDPGANTVTVRLYELVNGASTLVDSFDITTANFTTYYSLMDMFGLPHLAGDNLKVAVIANAAGPFAVTGEYSYAKEP